MAIDSETFRHMTLPLQSGRRRDPDSSRGELGEPALLAKI